MNFFKEGEPILYLSNDKGVKQQIEDGLNRDLITIASIDSLVENIEKSVEIYSKVNIILLSSVDSNIKLYLSDLANSLEAIHKKGILTTIEIGLDYKVFGKVNSLSFGTVVDFLEYTNVNIRTSEAKKMAQNSETREFSLQYRKLIIENEAKKKKIVTLENKLDESYKQINNLEKDIVTLNTKIETIFTVETENAIKDVEILKEQLIEIKRQRDVEIEKSKEYEQDLNKFRGENVSLKTELKSYQKRITDLRDEKMILTQDVKRLEHTLKTEQLDKAKLLTSRVDSEILFQLNEDVTMQRKRADNLAKENDQLKIQNKTSELKMGEYLQDIESLRAGEKDVARLGRTNRLDTTQLNTTSVFYFKIASQLPYFHSAVENLIDLLESEGKRVHTLILKNDEGIDSKKYSNYPLYPYLSDVKSTDKIFRLFPSHKMFNDVTRYEEQSDVLIVMDYIQSNEYYISTKSQYKVCTVVRKVEDMDKYGYKGKPITLGKGSVLDINYSEQIANSSVKENKFKMIRKNVEYWLKFGLSDSEL